MSWIHYKKNISNPIQYYMDARYGQMMDADKKKITLVKMVALLAGYEENTGLTMS